MSENLSYTRPISFEKMVVGRRSLPLEMVPFQGLALKFSGGCKSYSLCHGLFTMKSYIFCHVGVRKLFDVLNPANFVDMVKKTSVCLKDFFNFVCLYNRWLFQRLCTPTEGRDPVRLMFFSWVEATNQIAEQKVHERGFNCAGLCAILYFCI